MSNKVLWCVIAMLAATCVGEAYYIHTKNKNDKPASLQDPLADQDKWIAEARKNLFKGYPIPFRQFDDLFNDDFFGRKFDPFAEIENFHKRFNPLFNDEEKPMFGRSWNNWFQNRMGIADIRPETTTTDKEVILSLKIPGLAGESLNINVNDDRIRIAYDAKSVQDKKDEKGSSYFKSESMRHFEKIMPIPEGADPKKNRIVHEGNTVKIIFEKRQHQAAKS